MTRHPVDLLRTLAASLATAAGVPHEDATVLADALIDADLQGVGTHGLSRLAIYLERIQLGLIDPAAALSVDRKRASTLALDAGNGLGQVQAVKALEMMMPMAKSGGVAVATLRNSQHFGALSYYCNLAAQQGMILLAMTNCEPAMSPAGGYDAFFGTNPIAASFPTGKGYTVRIDLATSIIARGKIIAAQKGSGSIPEGWALDPNGNATTSAEQALLGTVLTMAGHKGYALALMVELFSSVLSGSAIGPDIGSMYKNLDRKQDVGHFFCLLDIDAFMDLPEFHQRIDETIDRIKRGRRRPGVEEILVPGERSARVAESNRRAGIELAAATVADLRNWSDRLRVSFILEEVTK